MILYMRFNNTSCFSSNSEITDDIKKIVRQMSIIFIHLRPHEDSVYEAGTWPAPSVKEQGESKLINLLQLILFSYLVLFYISCKEKWLPIPRSWLVGNSDRGMFEILIYLGHLANSYQSWKYSIDIWFLTVTMDERLIFPTNRYSKSNGKNFQMTKIAQDFDHSTIRILHHSTSWECVTTFLCSLYRIMPNEKR